MELEKRMEQQAIYKVPEKGTRPLPFPHACHYPDEQILRLQEEQQNGEHVTASGWD